MTGEDGRKSGDDGVKTFYIGFLALGLIIGVILGIAVGASFLPQNQAPKCTPGAANVLTPEEAGEKVIDFIADYAVPPGVEVTLINVTEVENANLYKVAIDLSTLETSETQEVYVTKDGELLFPGAINIEEFIEMVETQQELEENQGMNG
jgi:hypothetical protein